MSILSKKDISNISYNAVDLALPSGILWADRNVGAESVEVCGTYFAWGETDGYTHDGIKTVTTTQLCNILQNICDLNKINVIVTKENINEVLLLLGYTSDNNDLSNIGTSFAENKCFSNDWSDYFDFIDVINGRSVFNKYNFNNYSALLSEDDAATVNMGSNWGMPTERNFEELLYNTTITYVDINNNEVNKDDYTNNLNLINELKGIRFTGSNGNSIFIPVSNLCKDSHIINKTCCLWSNELLAASTNNPDDARCLEISYDDSVNIRKNISTRYIGNQVRGVIRK